MTESQKVEGCSLCGSSQHNVDDCPWKVGVPLSLAEIRVLGVWTDNSAYGKRVRTLIAMYLTATEVRQPCAECNDSGWTRRVGGSYTSVEEIVEECSTCCANTELHTN